MKWEDIKDELKWEWHFWKRNPEFPIIVLISILIYIYTKTL